MTCRPGHAPKHPDFEPGNSAALKFGVYSPVVIEAKAAEVHAELLRVAPWCDEERYLPSVLRYLQATAREQLAHEAIANSSKVSPRLFEVATACARLAWVMADQLGLTPAGHARLKVLVADATSAEAGLADLAERGRQIRERRAAQLAADGNDGESAGRRNHV